MCERSGNEGCSGRGERSYDVTVAIVGNPNVGKSTMFNILTGKSAHVANWPGVTVETKEGLKEWGGLRIRFVDLPGIYGLSALSLEEVVSREYIVEGDADLVIGLVDATAPERSLYLPIQLLELTPKVVIALTKIDEMDRLGIHIHYDKLESLLGVPVIPTSAIQMKGIRELLHAVVEMHSGRRRGRLLNIDYGSLEPFIAEVSKVISKSEVLRKYPPRWAAIKLLEGDRRLEDLLLSSNELEIYNKVQEVRESLRRSIGRDPSELIINTRFEFVNNITKEVVVRVEGGGRRELVDQIFSKPLLGMLSSIAILFTSLFLVFSINMGFPLNIILRYLGLHQQAEAIEAYSLNRVVSRLFDMLSAWVKETLEGYSPLIASLVGDGVVVGLGAVISFLPLIFMVFLMLAVLEDSGLAPRIAVSFHNVFSRFGYSGSAIYPLIVGMGCNVPAVLASRTSVDESERFQMILSAPFIPCQARLIVVSALVTAYFKTPLLQALAFISMYFAGVAMYLLTGLVLRKAVFKVKENPELILELPLMHIPKLRVVWWIAWDYTKHFLRKAGVILFSLSIVVWALINLGPSGVVGDISESFVALIGGVVAHALKPFDLEGGNAWVVAFALTQGFIAKESIIGTLALIQGTADVGEAVRSLGLTVPQAYVLILFITLYVPCLATVAVILQESKSLRLTVMQVLYMTSTAYLISLLTYHILKILAWVVGVA